MLTLEYPPYGYTIRFTTNLEDLTDQEKVLVGDAAGPGMTLYRHYMATIYLPLDWWQDPERKTGGFPFLCDVIAHEAGHAVSRMWEHASCFPRDADDMEHTCCHVGHIVGRILRHLGYS